MNENGRSWPTSTSEKHYKTRNLANFANFLKFVKLARLAVLMDLKDWTAPYEDAKRMNRIEVGQVCQLRLQKNTTKQGT